MSRLVTRFEATLPTVQLTERDAAALLPPGRYVRFTENAADRTTYKVCGKALVHGELNRCRIAYATVTLLADKGRVRITNRYQDDAYVWDAREAALRAVAFVEQATQDSLQEYVFNDGFEIESRVTEADTQVPFIVAQRTWS